MFWRVNEQSGNYSYLLNCPHYKTDLISTIYVYVNYILKIILMIVQYRKNILTLRASDYKVFLKDFKIISI